MLALQYYQSSQTLPAFINDADQVTRMLGQRKSYKCAKQVGVAVAAGEGLLTAASNWLLGLNHAKWNWFFTWNFMLLGVIAILQTLLLQFSVSKMWASLAKSPGLQRNDRIMWVHQIAFSTYAMTWFGDMIFSWMTFKTTWRYSFDFFVADACLRAICCLITNLIFLHLAYRYTF
jgi:hypothetical protein